MYLLLWCQCRCFKWKKMTSCFVLCTQDFWKSKEKPFLWLTQLKSSCHSNVRSQLSCFCFILNKLFLLRKMFFCLEVNWRQTFDPFVCSWGVTCCCSDLVCLEQEAGRPSLWLITVCQFWRITSVTVTPFVCSEGDHLLLGPQLDEEMVLLAGTKEAGASTVSLTTVHESGALLVWRAGVAEI